MKPSTLCLSVALLCIAGGIGTGGGLQIVYFGLVQIAILFSALCRAIEDNTND